MVHISFVSCFPFAALFPLLALLFGHSCNASSFSKIHTISFLGAFVFNPNANGNVKCVPSSCGDISTISYLFRLEHDPKHCGDPKYTLECRDNVTMLPLHSGEYYVKEINYSEGRIRVVDPGLEKNNCSSLPRFPFAISTFNFDEPSFGTFLSTPLTFLRCPNPVAHSSSYVQTDPCVKSEGYGYVKVGRTTMSELEDGCTIESTTLITTSATKEKNIMSYKDIHKEMVYGFELEYNMTYIFVKCRRDQWSSVTSVRCFPHSFTGFLQLVWDYIYHLYILRALYRPGQFIPEIENIMISTYVTKFILGAPFVIALLIHKWRRRHLSSDNNLEHFLHSDNFIPIRYTYSNIKKMSNGFKDKLGAGGFGSVFKMLVDKSKANGEDFISEVATIGRIHHVNVVRLVGYCVEGSKRALVYDFMPNGSLNSYIYSYERSTTLDCNQIYQIAIGVARGIEYLHRGCEMQILHFDIKPHNILLDKNFAPKISDFGLAKLYPANNSAVSTMAARGTMGYIAPELFYKNIGVVSHKADVYSFGMLLIEMASKRKNLNAHADRSSQLYFPSWVHDQYNEGKEFEIHDDATEEEKMLARKMIMVALWCIQMRPSDRHSMKEAIVMLEGEVERLTMPMKPSLCPEPLTGDNLIPASSHVELTFSLSAR